VAAITSDLGRVFVVFAIGAAVLLVGHAGTGGVGAFLLISHKFVISSGVPGWQSLSLDASSGRGTGWFSATGFRCRSPQPQSEHFRGMSCPATLAENTSHGMIDELITRLAKNSTLRIVSRTSVMQYKGAHRPLGDIEMRSASMEFSKVRSPDAAVSQVPKLGMRIFSQKFLDNWTQHEYRMLHR
jgi:hypothetical protein